MPLSKKKKNYLGWIFLTSADNSELPRKQDIPLHILMFEIGSHYTALVGLKLTKGDTITLTS